MATVRVYLCTYRRDNLLPRALNSLLAQSFRDWICEVHNDDPSNAFPRRLVESVGDPRVIAVDHERNLGTTATFNLVFQETREEFVSLLEDDNWWEPQFLEVMVDTMRAWPHVDVGWSNMHVWQEGEDGSWNDTGTDLWSGDDDSTLVELHYFPALSRIGEARHSNGAMLVRNRGLRNYVIPASTPQAAMEPFRERTFPHPLLFVQRPLANFALTRSTTRSRDMSTWVHAQLVLVASFLRNVPLDRAAMRTLWARARKAQTRSTNDLLLAALLFKGARHALGSATLGDALRLFASLIRHPSRLARTLRRIQNDRELLPFVDKWTAQRTAEALEYGLRSFSASTGLPEFRDPGIVTNGGRSKQLPF